MNNVGKTIKKIDGTVIFPEWMQIVSSIEKDVIKKDNVKSKILYHYTGLDGFMSIMQHRDFGISNIRFMNDSQEFKNGKKVCKKIVELRMEKEVKYKLFCIVLLFCINER